MVVDRFVHFVLTVSEQSMDYQSWQKRYIINAKRNEWETIFTNRKVNLPLALICILQNQKKKKKENSETKFFLLRTDSV